MPSSTSSSERESTADLRAPQAPYARLWAVAAVCLLILLAAYELALRSVDQVPSVTDDLFLWSYRRSQVYPNADVNKIVVLGSSRSMLGIVPEVLEREMPGYQAIHLAVDGQNPFPAFRDLAEDERFNGILVVDITEGAFLGDVQAGQQKWVDYYHREWSSWGRFEKILNLEVQMYLQTHLVLFNSTLNIRQFFVKGFDLPLAYYYFRPDRYRPAFYRQRMTPEQLEAHRQRRLEIVRIRNEAPGPNDERVFSETLQNTVRPLVETLEQRGGKVVFLRMPTCGEHWAIDESNYPKSKYWDQIGPLTGGISIHFLDTPGLADFDCPDTSHLDAGDAPEFTARFARALAKELQALQAGARPAAPSGPSGADG